MRSMVASADSPSKDAETRRRGDARSDEKKAKLESGKKTASKPRPIVRFHTSTSPFTVERDLRVKIATKLKSPHPPTLSQGERGEVVRPGDELEVTVTTTDPQGKPVAAELSLAMVEQSLLERFASPLPSIGDFFRGVPREPAVRCTSSITFSYRPATQPINPRLLAEKDREEIAKEEAESRRAAEVALADQTLNKTTAAGTVLSLASPSVAMEDQAGRLSRLGGMFGMGVNSDAGLVGDIVVDHDQSSDPGTSDAPIAFPDAHAWNDLSRRRSALNQPQSGLAQQANGGFQYWHLGIQAQMARNEDGNVKRILHGVAEEHERLEKVYAVADLVIPVPQLLQLNGGNGYAGGSTVTAGDLNGLIAQNQTQVLVVDNSGKYRAVRLGHNGKLDDKRAAAMAAEFNSSGAILLSALLPQETGYWNPVVTTGADGTATVDLTVPERSTAWKFLAKGLSTETLAGEATDDLTVKKDLFGEIRLPLAFTQGDTAEIPVTVHNDVLDKGPMEVVLRTTIAGRRVEETKTIEVTGKGLSEVSFKAELKRPTAQAKPQAGGANNNPTDRTDPTDRIDFELDIRAAGHEDIVQRSVPLRPYGVPVFAAASGSSTADGTVWLEAPEGIPAESASMQILVGPTVERSLLDIVLAPAPWCQLEVGRLASGLESAASDVMASLGLQKLLGGSRDAGGPEMLALDSRIRGSISLLLSAQNEDGGWSWTGTPGGASNRFASGRIVWALTLVRKAGYVVPDAAYDKALGYLQNQVAATDNADYESKAILLHVLAVAGRGDFALANRLYRDRNALSSAALAHLALSFAAMDRKPTAEEILGLLEKRNLDDTATRRDAAQGALPWSGAPACGSPAELRALYALAIEEVCAEVAQGQRAH